MSRAIVPSPVFPVGMKVQSPAAKRCVELHNACLASSAELRAMELRHAHAVGAVSEAAAALKDQVRKPGYDPDAEGKLGGDLREARTLADEVLHRERIAGEESRLAAAVNDYLRHVISYGAELFDELREPAERATDRLAAARAACAGPITEYGDVRNSALALVSLIRGPRPAGEAEHFLNGVVTHRDPSHLAWLDWDLPQDETEVPLPPVEKIEAHREAFSPVEVS